MCENCDIKGLTKGQITKLFYFSLVISELLYFFEHLGPDWISVSKAYSSCQAQGSVWMRWQATSL